MNTSCVVKKFFKAKFSTKKTWDIELELMNQARIKFLLNAVWTRSDKREREKNSTTQLNRQKNGSLAEEAFSEIDKSKQQRIVKVQSSLLRTIGLFYHTTVISSKYSLRMVLLGKHSLLRFHMNKMSEAVSRKSIRIQ